MVTAWQCLFVIETTCTLGHPTALDQVTFLSGFIFNVTSVIHIFLIILMVRLPLRLRLAVLVPENEEEKEAPETICFRPPLSCELMRYFVSILCLHHVGRIRFRMTWRLDTLTAMAWSSWVHASNHRCRRAHYIQPVPNRFNFGKLS